MNGEQTCPSCGCEVHIAEAAARFVACTACGVSFLPEGASQIVTGGA